MKPVLPLLALAALIAPLASAESKTFPAGDFSAIDTRGGVSVIFEQGPAPSIVVEQDEGDFSDIFIDQSGNTLLITRVSLRDASGWRQNVSLKTRNGRKIVKVNGKRVPAYTIRVTAPALSDVKVANSAGLTASGLAGASFSGQVSSSGDLILSGTAADADLKASSSGDLDGRDFLAQSLKLDASSSADISAAVSGGLLDLEASSSADVEVTVAGATRIGIDASSSADVVISGACEEITVSASSSADVDAGQLKCTTGDLQANSGADVSAYLTGAVHARASSGGDISISGNPETRDLKESSGGDINING